VSASITLLFPTVVVVAGGGGVDNELIVVVVVVVADADGDGRGGGDGDGGIAANRRRFSSSRFICHVKFPPINASNVVSSAPSSTSRRKRASLSTGHDYYKEKRSQCEKKKEEWKMVKQSNLEK
jgi:hypothetical protein